MMEKQLSEEHTMCSTIIKQLDLHVEEVQSKNKIFSTATIKKLSRKRRGLINGISIIANEAFGVLDERFAERYEKDIEKAEENSNYMLSMIKNQT